MLFIKLQARDWCFCKLQKVFALLSASFEKSGLNDENFRHFWFSSEMQQRAERRQCAPWDHSTSVFVVVVVVVVVVHIQKFSCCTIIHKVGSFRDNCTNKFVCT